MYNVQVMQLDRSSFGVSCQLVMDTVRKQNGNIVMVMGEVLRSQLNVGETDPPKQSITVQYSTVLYG
jgi:hypothetical protein